MKKQHTNAHQDYLNLIAEQNRAERLQHYQKELNSDATSLDELLKIAHQKSVEHNNLTQRSKNTMSENILTQMRETAANKPAFSSVIDTEETIRRVMPQPQNDIRRLDLTDLTVNEVLNNNGSDIMLPRPGNLGNIGRFAADIVTSHSKVVQAGAHIILIDDAPEPRKDSSGKIYFNEAPAGLIVAEPSNFSVVADGANVTPSDPPVYRALMNRSTAATHMWSTILPRRMQKDYFNGELDQAILVSIARGLSRVIDRILLDAIIADTPANFSIAAAAARGLNIDDLRALIGTAGTSASFNGQGKLVANNIPAELTDSISQTCIGAFDRAAVGLMKDITLIASRANSLEGETTVTAIINAQALLPVTGSMLPFWLGV